MHTLPARLLTLFATIFSPTVETPHRDSACELVAGPEIATQEALLECVRAAPARRDGAPTKCAAFDDTELAMRVWRVARRRGRGLTPWDLALQTEWFRRRSRLSSYWAREAAAGYDLPSLPRVVAVLLRDETPTLRALVALVWDSRKGGKLGLTASNKELADLLQVSRRTVIRTKKRARGLDLIAAFKTWRPPTHIKRGAKVEQGINWYAAGERMLDWEKGGLQDRDAARREPMARKLTRESRALEVKEWPVPTAEEYLTEALIRPPSMPWRDWQKSVDELGERVLSGDLSTVQMFAELEACPGRASPQQDLAGMAVEELRETHPEFVEAVRAGAQITSCGDPWLLGKPTFWGVRLTLPSLRSENPKEEDPLGRRLPPAGKAESSSGAAQTQLRSTSNKAFRGRRASAVPRLARARPTSSDQAGLAEGAPLASAVPRLARARPTSSDQAGLAEAAPLALEPGLARARRGPETGAGLAEGAPLALEPGLARARRGPEPGQAGLAEGAPLVGAGSSVLLGAVERGTFREQLAVILPPEFAVFLGTVPTL